VADDAGRPQDQGRRHRAKGQPSVETSTLLAEYQETMRAELRTLLHDIRGRVPDPGLHLLDEAIARGDVTARVQPPLKERIPMWELAIKLGRELGTEVDPAGTKGAGPPALPARRRRGRRVDFGPDR